MTDPLREAAEALLSTYDAYRRRGVSPAPKEYADVVASIEALRLALEREDRDAARYRRLRALSDTFQDWKVSRTRINEYGRPERQWMHGATLDAAIDAAMEGKD